MKKHIVAATLLAIALGWAAAVPGVSPLPPKIGEKALAALLAEKGTRLRLLDVRTLEEFEEGRIPGAEHYPYSELEKDFIEPDKDRPIVVYCRSGRRSAIAKKILEGMGYTNVSDFGGYDNWTRGLERD